MRRKCATGRGPGSARPLQPRIDRVEADARRIHRIGRGDGQHRHHDAREGAPELEPDQGLEGYAQDALAAEHEQERDAGDRVGHRQRNIDQRRDRAFAGKARPCQPVGEGHADQAAASVAERIAPSRLRRTHRVRRPCAPPLRNSSTIGSGKREERKDQERRQQDAEEPAQEIKPEGPTRRGALVPRAGAPPGPYVPAKA